jgi:hypothetical protein
MMAENVVHTHAAAGEARSVEYLVCSRSERASGFSQNTLFPALRAGTAISARRRGGVAR